MEYPYSRILIAVKSHGVGNPPKTLQTKTNAHTHTNQHTRVLFWLKNSIYPSMCVAIRMSET